MGKKEKIELWIPPVVKKYKVEVINKTQSNCKVIIGNQGHSMESVIYASKAQLPKYWEIEFSDVPDIRLYGPAGKKSFGLRDSQAITNTFVIDEDGFMCKNTNPLQPRNTTANPEIYGTIQEQHMEILKNSSRKECSYFIGDDWHNISGTLDSGNTLAWKLVISQIPQMTTHQWGKIDELGSRRNKFSIVGSRTIIDGEEQDDLDLNYNNHVFEINDNWELLRDGCRQRLWKWDWE